jgi:hypothetical protein
VNIRRFLRQQVSYEARVSVDDWNRPTFAPAVTLPARVEETQAQVRSPGGVLVMATTRVMLAREVYIGDKINGLEVQARKSIVDIAGKTLGWTVYL